MYKYLIACICLAVTNTAISQPLTKKQLALLDSMDARIANNDFVNLNSVLISRVGNLVHEAYFNGWNKDSLHDSRSSFKSITALLTGIAIDKGFIKGVEEKVYSFFPEYVLKDGDSLKKQMTIRHLLKMESGYDCEEFNSTKDCEGDMSESKDWVAFALNLPMKDKPGTVWAYTSCNPMILSGIIRRATGMSIMDFAKKYLFGPLGITHYNWTVDPSGNGMTAGSFYILPADMLKIGEMVKQGGLWRGNRIISKAWLKDATAPATVIPGFSFVKSGRIMTAIPQQAYYGYYWYNEKIKTQNFEENVVFASGNGGQYIMIIKSLDLVVVFTQGNYNNWQAKRAFEILATYIIPAFKQGT